jgi:hypothetical protein
MSKECITVQYKERRGIIEMANTKKIDYVILGLLSHEPLTGYDIKQRLDSCLRQFWGASFGSIYPTLNLLLRNEMITSEDISQNTKRIGTAEIVCSEFRRNKRFGGRSCILFIDS